MSNHPTATFHEAAIRDYHHSTPSAPRRATNRDDLEIAAAYAVFGEHVDRDTPIGRQVVETVGRELVAPMVGAFLSTQGVHLTFDAGTKDQP